MSGFLHWALWAVTGIAGLLAGGYAITAHTEGKSGERRVSRWTAAFAVLFLLAAVVTGLSAGVLR